MVQQREDTDGVPVEAAGRKGFRNIEGIDPLYILPGDPLAEAMLIPCFHFAENVDSMMGFFSSNALASLAPGLATFINHSSGTFRMVISPFLNAEDRVAVERGALRTEEAATAMLTTLLLTEDEIERHTLRCLSWLIQHGRIEIKIALMKNAMFHMKVWLFHCEGDVIAAHGSGNMTPAGITRNIEQVVVSKSWENSKDASITQRFEDRFASLWGNEDDDCVVVGLPEAIRGRLLQIHERGAPPQESELQGLYDQAELIAQRDCAFVIPDGLTYDEGPFAHQGKAVQAWREAGYRGVLEMATGSGKTITSMIGAHHLHRGHEPLLIVVAAPYVPLIEQWCDEIGTFGIKPLNLTEARGKQGRGRLLGSIGRRLRSGTSDVEAIIVSHRTLADEVFQQDLEGLKCAKLLIADEAHNLGSEGFISNPPEFFDYRLGLSATPVRQYDEKGTESLFDFLGPVVYRFTLEEAIGHCLVEYDYHVHAVRLADQEMDRWYELTALIRANAWRDENGSDSDEYLLKLKRDRRAVLELAEGKIDKLGELLDAEDLSELRHTLIYASDKGRVQLNEVNRLLKERRIRFHQLTHEETADRGLSSQIIGSFQQGVLQVMTAMRVLDEGVNIPEVRKAFILASTTVERQWVQRRGRLLRKCEAIGKVNSEIHDFVVIPKTLNGLDDDASALVKNELQRVREFGKLARNAGLPGGPLETIERIMDYLQFGGGYAH